MDHLYHGYVKQPKGNGDLRTIGFWFLLSLVNGGSWDHDFIVFNQW